MAQETDWLRSLLGIRFLRGTCSIHQRNKFMFCIDCELNFCTGCKQDHDTHRQIRLYRNNKYDVFHLEDIQNHFDCSQIQTYTGSTGEDVRLKSKPSGNRQPQPARQEIPHATCAGCGESPIYTQEPYTDNRFCSIECKLSVPEEVEPENDESDEGEPAVQESVEQERDSS